MSAKEGRGIAGLLEKMGEVVTDILSNGRQAVLPSSWDRVREVLRSMQTIDPGRRTMTVQEFEAICPPEVSNADVLLSVMHGLGVVFYKRGLFGNQIILNQSWALDAIYTISSRDPRFRRQLERSGGRFVLDDLCRFFWSNFKEEEQRVFLSLMEECGICFQVTSLEDAVPEYLAPEYLPCWGRDHEEQFRWQLETPPDASAKIHHLVLHDGIARWVLSEIGKVARERATYWRFGCHFYDRMSQSEVMIRTVGDSIQIDAWRGDAKRLLKRTQAAIVNMPFKLDSNAPAWELMSNVVAEELHQQKDCNQGQQFGLTPIFPRKVFLSYSHEPRSRDFVDGLVATLKAKGWNVVVDVTGINAGDSIREFCRQVRECPFFVPIIGDSYLKKRWCLSELVNFFESCRCDIDVYGSRCVAAVDSGQIDDPKLIAEHQKYFSDYLSSYLSVRGDLDHWSGQQIRQLHRWSDQLSNLLAPFSDELGTFGFEELIKQGYGPIVDSLEQKYARANA